MTRVALRPGVLALGMLSATQFAVAQATVSGVVFDSLRTHAPLANATVMLNELSRIAMTDARGRFHLDSAVPAGRYTMTFFHPGLDSLSIAAELFPVTVPATGRVDVRMATPSPRTLVRKVCGADAGAAGGFIVGYARNAEDSIPFARIEVRTGWRDLAFSGGIRTVPRDALTKTDDRGAYLLCGIPTDVAVTIRVTADSTLTGAADAVLGANLVARVDFDLDRRLVAEAPEAMKICSTDPIRSSGSRRGREGGLMVRVQVTDPGCAPLPGADAQVVRRVHDVVTSGTTDSAGRRTLSIRVVDEPAYQLVVRKIGFAPATRFFTPGSADTLDYDITLSRAVTRLAAVRVTERGTRPPPYYFVESDEIAAFDRPLDNAWDVIRKMRPDMISRDKICPTLQDLFVNGRRQLLDNATPGAARSGEIISLLKDVRPEHVAEIRYIGCFDRSLGTKGLPDAVIVVLKPDVEWVRNRGTFVVGAVRP